MLGAELANLALVLAIIAGPALLVWLTRAVLIPSIIALVYTMLAVIASAFIWSAGFGYGGWLMASLPLSPLILLYGWIVASLASWWMRRWRPAKSRSDGAAPAGAPLRFGRDA